MPESVSLTQAVEASVTVRAAPETVFRFFADPEWFARWMGADAQIEPRRRGAPGPLLPAARKPQVAWSRSTRRTVWSSPTASRVSATRCHPARRPSKSHSLRSPKARASACATAISRTPK